MRNYEELVKRLRDLPHLLFVQLHGHEDVVYQAADAIEKLTDRNVGKWVPVTERLPESKDERVLVCGERGGITIARYFANQDYGGGFQHTFLVQGNKTMKVIAWMPLPEPPSRPHPFHRVVAKG